MPRGAGDDVGLVQSKGLGPRGSTEGDWRPGMCSRPTSTGRDDCRRSGPGLLRTSLWTTVSVC